MLRLTDILDKVKGYHPAADVDLINKAYVYSARMHEGQMRKSGEPYFVHPVSVADIIADMKLDAASVCAALLHDVIEDTPTTEKELGGLFGEEVAFLVDGVTKLGKINFISKEDQQAESFRKMLVAMARDIRVLLVKLADRLDNMRTMEHMKPEAQERISRETVEIYAPLAGRLGINWLKAELEDLSFQYLHPEAFAELSRRMKKTQKDSERYIDDVNKRLSKMLVERGFAADVSGRMKHLYSIHRKMKQNDVEFEQITDLLAFRVMVENVSDCYAALGVVHSQWTPIPGRFKDYIALPKPNRYQSLHTSVIGPGSKRIEVQIRTPEMHKTAENGIAAHWQYKERSGGLDAKEASRFTWLRQLVEFQHELKDPTEFLESVKVDLFPDDVYVFTPKGDVKTFPRGSTPVDFAYDIHSEVGDHCVGARVNGAMVPLRHKLHNGDVVEILTNPQQHPSKDWIEFVRTGRARNRIRTYIRGEERKRSIKLGKDLLEREMHKRNVSFTRWIKGSDVEKTLEKFHQGTTDELFAAVGYGRIPVGQVVDFLCPKTDEGEAPEHLRPTLVERTLRKVTGKDTSDAIRIGDLDNMLVRYGKCCTPLQGDPITGWITRGRGVTVHRKGCPKALALDPERRIEVSWADDAKATLPVSLRVITSDKPGILSHVSKAFTENGLNITEATCRTSTDGRAVNTFQFAVGDVTKLRVLMRSIAKIQGVHDVERV